MNNHLLNKIVNAVHVNLKKKERLQIPKNISEGFIKVNITVYPIL